MSRSSRKRVVLITMGDPAGIGAEVTAKALLKVKRLRGVEPVVIGNQAVWDRVWPSGPEAPLFIHATHDDRVTHRPGKPTPESGRDSLLYLEKAVAWLREGRAQALVTAPVSKESICRWSPGFKGHTTYLAEAFGKKNVEMVFVADKMFLVLVTRHVPVRDLSELITRKKVVQVVSTTHDFLAEHFPRRRLRIAVLGLNPHAGEGGHIGKEDLRAIVPAVRDLRARGLDAHGPFAADTFFEPRNCRGYDLVAAMYHDQGLIALKALYFDRLVNLTVGLPFIRTSPAHGTAFAIAGKGVADAGSMIASLALAAGL